MTGPIEARLPLFLTFEHVAELAHVPVARVRRWQKRRKLPSVRPPGTKTVLFPREAILAWLSGKPVSKSRATRR